MVLRVRKFESRIFHNFEGQSQSYGFPWHPTPCWRCNRLEQTALAQVPEAIVVQKQLYLQTSCLIVSSFGQHESCNRTYGRTMYSPSVSYEGIWGNGGRCLPILNLGVDGGWMVSFTPWPLYAQGKSRRFTLGIGLREPQILFGYSGGDKNILAFARNLTILGTSIS
jgi:hypothetical protein